MMLTLLGLLAITIVLFFVFFIAFYKQIQVRSLHELLLFSISLLLLGIALRFISLQQDVAFYSISFVIIVLGGLTALTSFFFKKAH